LTALLGALPWPALCTLRAHLPRADSAPAAAAAARRLQQRNLVTPVPERVWALRNVANSQLQFAGGAQQLQEAVGMLQEAAELSASHYGPGHPGGRPRQGATEPCLVPRPGASRLPATG
jgi:hypothetical protein